MDAVDQVGAWECGHVHKHGHAWESAGLLVRALCGKGPVEAGADASMVLCCRKESSRCTMLAKEDTLRLHGCCWRREHEWMQWTRWVHGSVGMCTSMGMPGRAQGCW